MENEAKYSQFEGGMAQEIRKPIRQYFFDLDEHFTLTSVHFEVIAKRKAKLDVRFFTTLEMSNSIPREIEAHVLAQIQNLFGVGSEEVCGNVSREREEGCLSWERRFWTPAGELLLRMKVYDF